MPPPAFLAAIKARRAEPAEPENESAKATEKPRSATKKVPPSSVKVASKLQKYKKMLNMGIPRGAVEQKMRADQLDPTELFAGLPANELPAPVPKQSSKTKKVTKAAAAAAEAATTANKASNNPLIAELQRAQKARADPEFKKKLEEERAARAAAAAAMPERSVLSKKASKLKKDLAVLNRKTEGVQKRLKAAGNIKVAAELDYLQAQRAAAEAEYTKEALLAELKAAAGREAKDAVNRKLTLLGIHTKMLEARIKLFKMKDELASVRSTLEERPSNSAALIKQRDLTKEIPKLEAAVEEAAKRLEAAKDKFGIPIPHVAPVSRAAAAAPPSKDKCVSRNIYGRCLKTRKQRIAERKASTVTAKPEASNNTWGW